MIDVLEDLSDPGLDAHTSIVFAYNVDLIFYDKLMRRRLTAAGAISQVVFCDATPYASALDGVDMQSRIGRAYSVTPVYAKGAFHPKAYMVLGRHKGRLIVGSGNSSIGGLVRNAEVFGRFDFDDSAGEPPHPAFAGVFDLAKILAARAVPAVSEQLDRAESWAPWLRSQRRPADQRVLHVGTEAGARLIDAIRLVVAGETVKRIIAVSASFDRKLDAVRELAQLAGGTHETIVILQSNHTNLDGDAVRGLPNIRWVEFQDPRPSSKHYRPDSYAHAKLYIIETEARDHLFFGSANLSSPALITGANVELLVQVPPEPAGTWIERLGLEDSLPHDARGKLIDLTWKAEDKLLPGLVHLAGVEWSTGRGWLVSATANLKPGVRLALGERLLLQSHVVPLVLERDGMFLGAATHVVDGTRFAWIVDGEDKQLSTIVAVTWPDVSRGRVGGWLGSDVDKAILCMKHGDVLGPVLFEFLDRVKDLQVLAVGSSPKKETPDDVDSPEAPARSTESFYTEATADSEEDRRRLALGDRSDLDLLASLVQPIGLPRTAPREDDDDEEDRDTSLNEEAERRALDSNDAPTDGSERASASTLPSAKRMRKAGRRLSTRVERAADSLDRTATAVLKQRIAIPPGLIARQVWMAYITGFVAGLPVETSEGDQVVVETDVFAHYVMRCACALAGDASGSLLRAIKAADWKTRDGATLRDGLRFLIAAGSWAVAWFEAQYKSTGWSPDDEQIEATGVHDAVPLLMLARLIAACEEVPAPDFADTRKRLSAWNEVHEKAIDRCYQRARDLAAWLVRVEGDAAPMMRAPSSPKVGSLVQLHGTGVTVVLRIDGDKLWVAISSRPSKPAVKFHASAARSVEPPPVGALLLAPVPRDLFGA